MLFFSSVRGNSFTIVNFKVFIILRITADFQLFLFNCLQTQPMKNTGRHKNNIYMNFDHNKL